MPDIAHFGGDDPRPQDIRELERRAGTERELIEAASKNPTEVRAGMALWLAGATYAEVAEQMGYRSAAQARAIIERALADTVDDTEDRSRLRQKVSLQLDRLMRSVIVKALDPTQPEQLAYVRAVVGIIDRKTQLHGLNAPIQAIVANPSGDELERWLATLAEANGVSVPVEGDPFVVIEEAPREPAA